jgi:cold shock CspA family protein
MKGIVNWYSDRKKQGLIEGNDGKDIMVYERDLPFLTILHAGDVVEYSIIKTIKGNKAVSVKQIKE